MATRALTLRVRLLGRNLKKEREQKIGGGQKNLLSGLSAN